MKWYFISSLVVQTIILIFFGINFQEIIALSKSKLLPQNSNQQAVLDKTYADTPIPQTAGISEQVAIASDLLSLEETTSLGNGQTNPIDLKEEEAIRLFFPGEDKRLKVVDIADDNFRNSTLHQQLKKVRSMRVYAIVKFTKPATTEILANMRNAGFSTVINLPKSNYIDKKLGVFYVPYRRIKPIKNYGGAVEKIFLIKNYTASGIYQLEIKSLAEMEDLSLQVNVPYTKMGRELLYNKNTLLGANDKALETRVVGNSSELQVDVGKNQSLKLFSEVQYHVDLQKSVAQHIYAQGDEVYLSKYKQEMAANNPELHAKFTKFSEKIVPSDYIDDIVSRIDTSVSFADIWKQIDIILDRDIRYDWKKRDLFFSGNLTYFNIKDMYMTAEELGIKKKGACPERTSLEIAILRKLGIASRSATRLYHIYTEIYIPNFGWTTTSLTLNEIPLTRSIDQNMAYFVSWAPNHPIRLKWEGQLYPKIAF